MSLIDVIGQLSDSKFEAHSGIVLTYGLDLLLYDGYLRRQFRASGAKNQIVFCDAGCYEKQLSSVPLSRFLGRSYSVTPVHQAAAFHPKVYLLLGRKRGRLIIGSGNATLGGLTRNAELFGVFDFNASSDAGPHPAFQTALTYLQELGQNAPGPVQAQIQRAVAESPWLQMPAQSDGRQLLIGGPGRPALLEQVLDTIGRPTIDRVLVCSASFDRRLAAMKRLSELSTGSPPVCLVQSDSALLDGDEVRRLGDAVDWKSLSIEHLRRNDSTGDPFAHAKLLVLESGDQETVVYGSANASAPALLDQAHPNTETVVVCPGLERGTAVEKLDLGHSLSSDSVKAQLYAKEWKTDDAGESQPMSIQLWGVTIDSGQIIASLSSEHTQKNIRIGVSDDPPPSELSATIPLAATGDRRYVGVFPGTAARLAWVVDDSGGRLSNAVAIMWKSVSESASSSGKGERIDNAISAMLDGQLLHEPLYELLNQVRDLPGHSGSKRAKKKQAEEENAEAAARDSESFYSDEVTGYEKAMQYATKERTDLNLLASLFRPPESHEEEAQEEFRGDEEDEFQSKEQGEHEGADEDAGEDEQEAPEEAETTVEQIEAYAQSLERRLDRIVGYAEEVLADPKKSTNVVGVARLLWMSHVAAFFAGRTMTASDGHASCLSQAVFAQYMIRLARALAGGKAGGLLSRLPEQVWTSYDGENLKRGVSFNWACTLWASAYLRRHWETTADRNEHPTSIAVAAPELVAARFSALAEPLCQVPDEADLAKRLPAFTQLTPEDYQQARDRVMVLAQLIRRYESDPPHDFPPKAPLVNPGDLVYSQGQGVTVAARYLQSAPHLINLSGANNNSKKGKKKASAQDPPWLKVCPLKVMLLKDEDGIAQTCFRRPQQLI